MSAGDELRRSRLRLAGYLLGLLAIAGVLSGIVVGLVLALGGDGDGGDGGDGGDSRDGGAAPTREEEGRRGRPCRGDDDPALRGTALQDGTVRLEPTRGAGSGSVMAACLEGELQLIVTARDLPRPERVELWLYNSRRDARSLGGQDTLGSSFFLARASLPRGVSLRRYRAVDLSAEPFGDTDGRHSGRSLMRGSLRAG